LVKRGWFYLITDFVSNWDKELKKIKKHKNGRPYRYPEAFIQFNGLAYAFLHLPYRPLEGFLEFEQQWGSISLKYFKIFHLFYLLY
jgi:hypothetical protein